MLAKRQLINSSIGLDWAVVLTVLGRSIINSVVFCVAGSKAMQEISKARNLWFLFPLALVFSLSSCHEKVIKWYLFSFKKKVLREKIIIWVTYIWQCFHSNKDVFTLKSWRLESERTRAQEEKRPTNSVPKCLLTKS